jgi:hypothetical protein
MRRVSIASAIFGAVVGAVSTVAIRASFASTAGNVLLLEYAVHDRGTSVDVDAAQKEKKEMVDNLNSAERDGWRIKGYTMDAEAGTSEHHFILERGR